MGKDDDFNNGEDLKDDFKNFFKHSKRAIRRFFRGGSRRSKCGGWMSGFPSFFSSKNPLLILLYPKLIVAGIILLTLLFCGVSLYGIIVIILLTIIFFLI
jgi:hypothetical protein